MLKRLADGLEQISAHRQGSTTFNQSIKWACWEIVAATHRIDIWSCYHNSPWWQVKWITSTRSGAVGHHGAPI